MLQLRRVISMHTIRQSHVCVSGSMHCGERRVVIMSLMLIPCHSTADLCLLDSHVVSVFSNTAINFECVQTTSHPHKCSSLSFWEVRCWHVPLEVCDFSFKYRWRNLLYEFLRHRWTWKKHFRSSIIMYSSSCTELIATGRADTCLWGYLQVPIR